MKKVVLIYDDRRMPGKQIRSITGDRSFGETILKRVKLSERIKGAALKNKDACDFIELADNDSFAKLNEDLIKRGYAENTAFFYMYSSFAINGERGFSFLLQKAAYAREVFCAKCRDAVAAVIFPDLKTLISYEERLDGGNVNAEQIDQDVFCDLSDQGNFRAYITGGFDARFFNALDGDEYTVTKRSPKREKLKSEYKFYELLPDDMKQWFVMPYDFREDDKGASYTMERIHTTDIAIRYVHGAVSEEELEDILGKLFYFLDHRKTKKTDEHTHVNNTRICVEGPVFDADDVVF